MPAIEESQRVYCLGHHKASSGITSGKISIRRKQMIVSREQVQYFFVRAFPARA